MKKIIEPVFNNWCEDNEFNNTIGGFEDIKEFFYDGFCACYHEFLKRFNENISNEEGNKFLKDIDEELDEYYKGNAEIHGYK